MGFTVPPSETAAQIRRLGERIRVARKRRRWTIAETATKVGINRNTLNALELGKSGVAISSVVAVLWVLGLEKTLETVADPELDAHGKTLEASRRPQRVRAHKAQSGEYDF